MVSPYDAKDPTWLNTKCPINCPFTIHAVFTIQISGTCQTDDPGIMSEWAQFGCSLSLIRSLLRQDGLPLIGQA